MMFKAMQRFDPLTDKPRGFMLLTSTKHTSLYFVISPRSKRNWKSLLKSLQNYLCPLVRGKVQLPAQSGDEVVEKVVCFVIEQCSEDVVDVFSTYALCCRIGSSYELMTMVPVQIYPRVWAEPCSTRTKRAS